MAKEDTEDKDLRLTDQELKDLEARALKEVEDELKADLSKDFLAQKKIELKKKMLFKHGKNAKGKDTVEVHLELAPNAAYIRLDTSVFYHGRTYRVIREQAEVLASMVSAGRLAEAENRGMDMNAFYGRKTIETKLSGANQ